MGTTLLSLPAEIRKLIWNYVFILPGAETQLGLSPLAARETSVLRVLCVCKSIYAEALHLFYRFNVLLLSSTTALFTFLSSLHPLRRSEITSLTVRGIGYHWMSFQCARQAFSLLLLCPKLKTFRLDLTTEESWDILERAPDFFTRKYWKQLNEGIDCLKSLRGLESGSIRGINPALWKPNQDYGLSDLEEVRSPRANALRRAWLRPTLQIPRRLEKAITDVSSKIGTSCPKTSPKKRVVTQVLKLAEKRKQ